MNPRSAGQGPDRRALLTDKQMQAREKKAATLPNNVRKLVTALTTRKGTLSPEVRVALLDRARAVSLAAQSGDSGSVPADVEPYVDKVTRWAYKVVDDDVASLMEMDYSEDQIFELTLCAATGAGLARFERGLQLLNEGGSHAT